VLAFIIPWIINAILLVLTDKLTDHLKIDSFGWALGGALVMAAIGTLGEWLVRSVFYQTSMVRAAPMISAQISVLRSARRSLAQPLRARRAIGNRFGRAG
jgi:Mycobacterial 4 TMS phage holin, superfamily IV